jgi:hypothetical protein
VVNQSFGQGHRPLLPCWRDKDPDDHQLCYTVTQPGDYIQPRSGLGRVCLAVTVTACDYRSAASNCILVSTASAPNQRVLWLLHTWLVQRVALHLQRPVPKQRVPCRRAGPSSRKQNKLFASALTSALQLAPVRNRRWHGTCKHQKR